MKNVVLIPKLQGSGFVLRSFQEGDVEALYKILQNPEVLRYFPASGSPSLEKVQKLVESQQTHWEKHGYGWWALAEGGVDALIGWCGLNYLPDTDEVELKYLLSEEYWGRGIATEASRLSLEKWIATTEIEEVIGLVHPQNIASQRVLEKVGMTFANRAPYFGMDLLRYTLRREQFSGVSFKGIPPGE
jgi:RimJ/RimL family protein N-acetyltransferase